MGEDVTYRDTYGGLVIDRERCAYCEAWPAFPCALHAPHPRATPAGADSADGAESER